MNNSIFLKMSLILSLAYSLGTHLALADTFSAKGKVTGFPSLATDDVVHGAAVFPALSAQDLLKFQLEDLLAPNEPMSAGPETLQVPGNLYVPEQKEKYSFFTITLSKPSFTAMLPKNEASEVFALQFKAPFSKLVSLAQNKAPYTEMLALVSTQSFGLLEEASWGQSPNASLTVPLSSKLDWFKDYTWNRPMPAPVRSLDLIVGFQKTKNSRWVPLSFLAKAPVNGKIQFSKSLESDFVMLFARIQNNANSEIESARVAFERKTTDNTQSRFVVNTLPEMPSELTLNRTSSKIEWNNNNERKGWVAIVRSGYVKNAFSISSSWPVFGSILGAFGNWFNQMIPSTKNSDFQTWAQAQSGSWSFNPPLKKGEKIAFLLVDTSSDTMDPGLDKETEPEVFTKATGLVMKSFEILD